MSTKSKFKLKGSNEEDFIFSEENGEPFEEATPQQIEELKNQKPVLEVFSWNPT
jgi:hypothetical protein